MTELKMIRSREDVFDVLYKELKELPLELEGLTPELAAKTTLESLGLSSLDTVQLVLALEEVLDMEIRATDLPKNYTVSEIADHLLRLGSVLR
jgi:acyl carrier protein